MADAGLAELSLTELSLGIASGRMSSVEATQSCLERFDRHGAALACVVACDHQAALGAAARADQQIAAGNQRGPLHGVPLAHKDLFYRAGRRSGCGARIQPDDLPDDTATVLTRLDAAGVLDIARLRMAEFAIGTTTTGSPHNPWDPSYFPGESSSGSAVAVGARLTYGSLGTDTGGSVRIPASCCNLVGIKPTRGRVSRYGSMPLSSTLDHIGVLTRTVADCALLLGAVAGLDPHDPTTSAEPVPDYVAALKAGVRGIRIAVPGNYFPGNYFYEPVDHITKGLLDDVLDVYRNLGAEIVPVDVPASIEQAASENGLIIQFEAASLHREWLRSRRHDYGRHTAAMLEAGLSIPASRYEQALALQPQLLAEFMAAIFEKADVFHAPVMPHVVPTIAAATFSDDSSFMDFWRGLSHCTRPFNYLGLPALSLPAGFDPGGLPVGFQLVGRPFDEALLFRVGHAYEREMQWTRRAPNLVVSAVQS